MGHAVAVAPQCAPRDPDVSADAFGSFFEHSGMCMARLSPDLRVRGANQEFCRQFGWPAGRVVGSDILEVVHRSMHEVVRRQLIRVVQGRQTRVTTRVLAICPGSTVIPGQLTAVVINGSRGDGRCVSGLVLVFEPDVVAASDPPAPESTTTLAALDARILEGIAAGSSTIRLSAMCYLSRQGIEYRVGRMLRRHRVPNRTALVSKAYALGLFSVGVWPPRVLPDYVDPSRPLTD